MEWRTCVNLPFPPHLDAAARNRLKCRQGNGPFLSFFAERNSAFESFISSANDPFESFIQARNFPFKWNICDPPTVNRTPVRGAWVGPNRHRQPYRLIALNLILLRYATNPFPERTAPHQDGPDEKSTADRARRCTTANNGHRNRPNSRQPDGYHHQRGHNRPRKGLSWTLRCWSCLTG